MKHSEFFSELLNGDQHRDGIRCLRLFHVADDEFKILCKEIQQYRSCHQFSEVSESKHITHWVNSSGQVEQYSLLNRSGCSDDFSVDHDMSCKGKWFFDGDTYPLLGSLIDVWPHLINFRINILRPGAALLPHEEHLPFRTQVGSVGGRLRFHLPIQTNKGAELCLDGLVFHLELGFVYLVNQGCVHAAQNTGAETRVHLVFDSLLTEDLFEFLFEKLRVPPFLSVVSQRAQKHLRRVDVGPHRRLQPQITAIEAASLAFCQPQ